MIRINGGYISPDGQEIRTMPGFRTAVDPVSNLLNGYMHTFLDARRPVTRNNAIGGYGVNYFESSIYDEATKDTLYCSSMPTFLHAVKWARGRALLIGEADHRREVIYASGTTNPVTITSWAQEAVTLRFQLTMSLNVNATAGFHALRVNDVLYVDAVTNTNAADAARLAYRFHKVISVVLSVITLETTCAGPSVGAITGELGGVRVYKTRGNRSGSYGVDGRAYYGESDANTIDDQPCLAGWWIEDSIPVTGNPIERVYQTQVFNRMRDFGIDGPGVWPLEGRFVGTASQGPGYSRRRQKRIAARVVPDASGDRVLLAAPGYGCCFQFPAVVPVSDDAQTYPTRGLDQPHNDIWCRPRSLGIPKGLLLESVELDGGATPTHRDNFWLYASGGGAALTNFWEAGTWKFAIAYKDEATGEIGALSETFTVVVPADPAANTNPGMGPFAGYGVTLWFVHPQYAMHETGAMSILLFMTDKGGDALQHVYTFQCGAGAGTAGHAKYGRVTASSSVAGELFVIDALNIGAAIPRNYAKYAMPTIVPTSIEQPRGAKALRMCRGVCVFVGAQGNLGLDLELQSGTGISSYQEATRFKDMRDVFYIRPLDVDLAPIDNANMVAGSMIPSGYGGTNIVSRRLFPWPHHTQKVLKQINCASDSPDLLPVGLPAAWTVSGTAAPKNNPDVSWEDTPAFRYRLQATPLKWNDSRFCGQQSWALSLLRGYVQTGEPGLPHSAPGPGIQVVDSRREEDTEAVGEFRGVALACTKRQTFSLAWGAGPAGATPFLVNNSFGCIAPNTFVELDDMTIWISDRGPVAYTPFGSIEHVGRPLEFDFRGSDARYLRDSRGMMRHAWACHDESRNLVMFGLYTNRSVQTITDNGVQGITWAQATDDQKSKFAADEILIFSYKAGGWSYWHPPLGLEVLWMEPIKCADGKTRIVFLARDKRLYVFDDAMNDTNTDCYRDTLAAASVASTTVTVTTGFGLDLAARGAGNFVRAGMEVIIFDPDTNELLVRSTVVSANSAQKTMVLAKAVSVPKDSAIWVGVRSMSIETGFVSAKPGEHQTVSEIAVRARLLSPASWLDSGSARTDRAWVGGTLYGNERPTKENTRGDTSLLKQSTLAEGVENLDYIGLTEQAAATMQTIGLGGGVVNGTDVRAVIDFIGSAQVCLNDVLFEVG